MSAPEHVRHEWEESARRLEAAAGDRARYHELLDQVETVTTELRKRVGQTYTLAGLARAYLDAERWAAEALAESPAAESWPRMLSTVVGASFQRYARGATDYSP
ncbi:MAG: hypothetical protein WD689_05320 [Gaiellaceae bacterium]